MFIIVDLVIIAIIALNILLGYKRGLTGCLIKILSFFIALIISLILFNPFSNILINNTQIDENIQTSIVEVFEKEENVEEKEVSSPILDNITEEIEKSTEEKKNEIVNNSAKKLSINIVKILSFILLFIGTKILLIFVKSLTNLITKLPLIKQCDKIGGILFGVIYGFIIVFIALALITFISTIINNYELLELINNSYLGNMLNNNNILVKLIF